MARLNVGDVIDGGLALLYRAMNAASSDDRSTGTVGLLIEKRPFPLTKTSKVVMNGSRVPWSAKTAAKFSLTAMAFRLACLLRLRTFLPLTNQSSPKTFDERRIVFGLDHK